MSTMKCSNHPLLDAVGNCVYCGRGVCDDCKVRFNELIHCKECVEAGRVRGGPAAATAQPYYPVTPQPVYINPMMMGQMYYQEPKPTGPVNLGLFQMGAAGALITAGFLFSVAIFIMAMFSRSFFYYGSMSLTSELMAGLVISVHLPFYLLLFGYMGLRRNYGSPFVLSGVVGFLAFHSVSMIFWIASLALSSSGSYFYLSGTLFIFMDPPVLAGALFFLGYPLRGSSFHIPPGHPSRTNLGVARALIYVSALLFAVYMGIIVIGWVLLGIAMLFLFQAFRKAPMPGDNSQSQAPGMPPNTQTAQYTQPYQAQAPQQQYQQYRY